ncbi:hypothetical protein BD289DRAFT_478436 [Coniella lustricola]|uniref:Uncharacterized protein n=1 Tax=Coniella lustricola TaxID=2025994 RepID=A0A2T3AMG4_9PEZI|nr:hypothetical protein BD289DRAFT_478436 [Coniella lustricola]
MSGRRDSLTPPERSGLKDAGAHELGDSDSDDHFSDAQSAQSASRSPCASPIPKLRVEKVSSEPSYGEVPGTEAYKMREEDAEPDEIAIVAPQEQEAAGSESEQRDIKSPSTPGGHPIPKTVVEESSGNSVAQSHPEMMHKGDSTPDELIKSPIEPEGTVDPIPPALSSPISVRSRRESSVAENDSEDAKDVKDPEDIKDSEDLVDSEAIETSDVAEDLEVTEAAEAAEVTEEPEAPEEPEVAEKPESSEKSEIGEVSEAAELAQDSDDPEVPEDSDDGEDGFGDDFDDFAEGDEEVDFDDFEDDFQEPETPSAPVPSSAPAVQPLSFPIPDFDGLDPDDIVRTTEPYLNALFPTTAGDDIPPTPTVSSKDNPIFLTQRSASLWSQLVAPPPLQPPDWIRSRIRRLFLVSLGVPVDLDEILPASKQKKLVLPSMNSPRTSSDSRRSGSRAPSRFKSPQPGQENAADVPPTSKPRGPPPPPEFDLVSAQQLCTTTDEALNGMTDDELKQHIERLQGLEGTAALVLDYWKERTDEQIKEREAFEGVIENLVKHARKTRK